MSKFYGKVGYIRTEEKRPGIYEEIVTERFYYGDITRRSLRWENTGAINDSINLTNEISIIADPYCYEHFSELRYIEFMGAKWKIASIQVERPRITLTLGGLYIGQ